RACLSCRQPSLVPLYFVISVGSEMQHKARRCKGKGRLV
ncbi:MAG: hypothetical protein ACJAUW_000727, partial [Yoonia sp.]